MLILCLVSIPSDKLPQVPGFMNLFQLDKLVHLLLFMILVRLMIPGLEKQIKGGLPQQELGFLCLLSGTLYGGLTEIYQHFFIPGRIASWTDFVANEAGCFAGWWLFKWQNRKVAKW